MQAKLVQLIEKAEKLQNSSYDRNSPEFKAWRIDVLRFLRTQYGENSTEAEAFKNLNFSSIAVLFQGGNGSEHQRVFQNDLETTILSLKNYLSDFAYEPEIKKIQKIFTGDNTQIFIVHGKDEGVKAQVSNLLRKLQLNPIILHEQANEGKTVIEKFEKYADVKAAVVLFTGDDVGKYKDDPEYEKRARQNVIFEAGYFMGKLGRENTIILAEEGLPIQSDLSGYIYIPLDERQRWYFDLAKELKAIGFAVDMNDLVGQL